LVDLKVQLLKQEFEENQRADKLLTELFDKAAHDDQDASVHELDVTAFRAAIERSQSLYQGILARLREIDSVRDYGGYNTQILAAPKTEWYVKQYLMVLGGGLFLGLMGGFGWAFLAEVRDKSFRTSHEIRERLGLPVVGQIPYFHSPVNLLPLGESNGAA